MLTDTPHTSTSFTTATTTQPSVSNDLVSTAVDCYEELDAASYRGNVNVTENGEVCQVWDVKSPHFHA